MEESISLSQKLYLLSIKPEKGGIIAAVASSLNYVLIGALFLELHSKKNVRFENKRIIVIDSKSNNDLHRFVLDKISSSNRPVKISRALGKFNFSMKYILKELQQSLVDKRMIRLEHKQFLFFKWKKPFLVNKRVVYKMVNEVESQIANGAANSEEDTILLSFIGSSGLLNRIYPERRKRKAAKKRFEKMMIENQVSEVVADAIKAAQVVAATVATSVAVGSATH